MLYEVITVAAAVIGIQQVAAMRQAMVLTVSERILNLGQLQGPHYCPMGYRAERHDDAAGSDGGELIVITSYSIHYTKLYELSSHSPRP